MSEVPRPIRELAIALARLDGRLMAWRARAALWRAAEEADGRLSWESPPELATGIRWRLGDTGRMHLGAGCRIGPEADFKVDGRLELGAGVLLGPRCILSVLEHVVIGPGCLVAEQVSIRDHDHRYRDPGVPIVRQGYRIAPVHLGADVWLGAGAVVMPGVTLGDGCVVGAHAVVTRSHGAGSILVGAPARCIGTRGGAA